MIASDLEPMIKRVLGFMSPNFPCYDFDIRDQLTRAGYPSDKGSVTKLLEHLKENGWIIPTKENQYKITDSGVEHKFSMRA